MYHINAVNSFSILNSNLILSKNQDTIEILNFNFESVYFESFEEQIQEVNSENKFIWTNTAKDGKGILFNNKQFNIRPYLIKSIDIEGNVYCRLEGKGAKIDIHENIIWKLEDKFFIYLIDKFFFFYRKGKVKIVTINNRTGTPLWQYDIGERYDYYARNEQYLESPTEFHQAEIRKIIGVYQEILWISLNTGRLIGLSVHNGAVVYDIAVPDDYPHRFFAVAQYSHLVAGQGKIIGLHAHWYWEIDLKNPIESYKLYILDDECTNHSLDVDHLRFHCLVGNELFFAQEEWAQEPSYVGIFDIQTKKITWTSHELGEDNVFQGIKKVEYQSNRLYVLDKASCLHIFEREANS